MTEYRIVRDMWAGFEVQSRRWWWPFWIEGCTNTHFTIERAEAYAQRLATGWGSEVKYLGKLPKDPAAVLSTSNQTEQDRG